MKITINTDYNSCLLSYYIYGSITNPLIVMLHGWSRSAQTYDQLAKTLSINYMVVTIDLPGFGSSEHLQFKDISLEGYSEIVKKFVKHIGQEYNKKELYILGHSFGGRNAINIIANDDLDEFKLVKGVFIAPSGYNQKGIKDEYELLSPQMKEFKNQIVEGYNEESSMLQDVALLREKNKTEKYQFIVINGDKDQAIPVEHSVRLAEEIGCQFWMFYNATHDVYLENNRGIATLVHDFIVGIDTINLMKDSSNIFNRKALHYTNEIKKTHLFRRKIIKQSNIIIQVLKKACKQQFFRFWADILRITFETAFKVISIPILFMDYVRKTFYEDEFLKIGVLFGGRSVEHEVSIQTAILIMNELSKGKNIKVYPLYLYNNKLHYSDKYMFTPSNFLNKNELTKYSSHIKLFRNDQKKIDIFVEKPRSLFGSIYKKYITLDNIIISTHGTNTEDGSIASYMEYKMIPYTGCNIPSSVIGQDKIIFKDYIEELIADFNQNFALLNKSKTRVELVEGVVVLESEYNNSQIKFINELEKIFAKSNGLKLLNKDDFLNYQDEPLYKILTELGIKVDNYLNIQPNIILKPAHLGSSIGISIIKNLYDFNMAFSKSFTFDNKVLVEKVIPEFRELNCSIKKTVFGVKSSKVSEENKDGFYSFEDKYISSKKTSTTSTISKRKFPAELSNDIQSIIQAISAKVYYLLGAKGVVRIDYMYDEKNSIIYLNEINNIPGSFAYYFWEQEDGSIRNYILSVIDDGLKEYKFKHKKN
jgi:D-alanine-D-alanine ligase